MLSRRSRLLRRGERTPALHACNKRGDSVFRKLKIIYQCFALIGTIANFSAIFGMILVGIFLNLSTSMLMHATGAILGFGGLAAGAIIY
ncbi:MAG: hypothetical protein ACFFD2_21890 [Promethearchaeota archaeon]